MDATPRILRESVAVQGAVVHGRRQRGSRVLSIICAVATSHVACLGHCFSGQLNSGPHAQCSRLLTHYIVLGSCWARRLELETVNLESVVIVGPARLYECRPLVCTHRPSHCPSPLVSEVVTRCPNWKVRMDTVVALSGGRYSPTYVQPRHRTRCAFRMSVKGVQDGGEILSKGPKIKDFGL